MRLPFTSSCSPAAGIYFRYLDSFGDPVVLPASSRAFIKSGSTTMRCFPTSHRVFEGFVCCATSSCFRTDFSATVSPVSAVLPRLRAKTSISSSLSMRSTHDSQLRSSLRCFDLRRAGVNCSKNQRTAPLKSSQHEYQVVLIAAIISTTSHRLLEVYAHYLGGRERCRYNRCIRPHESRKTRQALASPFAVPGCASRNARARARNSGYC